MSSFDPKSRTLEPRQSQGPFVKKGPKKSLIYGKTIFVIRKYFLYGVFVTARGRERGTG